MSIFSETPGRPRRSSPKRRTPWLCSSHRISDFHLPPTTSMAASMPQKYGPDLFTPMARPRYLFTLVSVSTRQNSRYLSVYPVNRTVGACGAQGCAAENQERSSMPDTTQSPVTVLGLGAMGQAFAATLLKGGRTVTVWNRTPGKDGDLVAAGAR